MSSMPGLTLIKVSSGLLMSLGIVILLAWHNPGLPKVYYLPAILMAYNTAICFLMSGIALFLFAYQRFNSLKVFTGLMFVIPSLTLIELLSSFNLSTSDWFYFLLGKQPEKLVPMAPTTALCFIFESVALFLLGLAARGGRQNLLLPTIVLACIVFVMALIALLGHGIGLLPIYVWQGVVMAPHTAVGHGLFALSLFIYAYPNAHREFDRLSVFNRMIIAFGTMVTLFIGVGSIAIVQIKSVSDAVDAAYNSQLNVNSEDLAVRLDVNNVERLLHALAIQTSPPTAAQFNQFDDTLSRIKKALHNTFVVPASRDATGQAEQQEIQAEQFLVIGSFQRWHNAVQQTYQLLSSQADSTLTQASLTDAEVEARELEQLIDKIILRTSGRGTSFKNLLQKAELGARLFVSLSILCLLSAGFVIIYFVTRSISNQLLNIRLTMTALADGKTLGAIPCLDNPREIGDMARTLGYFAEQIERRQQAEAHLAKIISMAPNGFIMVDAQGLVEIVNNEAERIFGYSATELIGKNIEILLSQEARSQHPQFRQEFFAHPSHRAMGAGRELYGRHKSGLEVPIEIGLAPLETADGPKVLASVVDITKRRKTEKLLDQQRLALENINHQLSSTNKELENFTYVASHDLKAPLRGINQISNWIDEDVEAKDYHNLKSHTRMLRKRVHRMEKLLDDLLNFYRAGHDKGELSVVDVKHLAREVFEIHNTNPDMKIICTESLPVFTTLTAPFEQVLRNLISNAIKHHDQPAGTITVSHRDIDHHYFEFCVADDGPGIPEAYHQRIFGVFQTLKPRDEVEGSGIGLSLIKKIVATFDGQVRIESAGRGSSFYFTWPKTTLRTKAEGEFQG